MTTLVKQGTSSEIFEKRGGLDETDKERERCVHCSENQVASLRGRGDSLMDLLHDTKTPVLRESPGSIVQRLGHLSIKSPSIIWLFGRIDCIIASFVEGLYKNYIAAGLLYCVYSRINGTD